MQLRPPQPFAPTPPDPPGRFLCNYIYWCSLEFCRDRDRTCSLFVHVPPFEEVPEEQQRRFLVALLKAVADAAMEAPVLNQV